MPLGYALGFPLGWVYALSGQIEILADDALDLLIQLLPQNASKLYGLWQKSGDPYNFYAGLAESLKALCYDYIALLRAETNPQTTTFKLGDWETALGIAGTQTATAGTAVQRRVAIISKLREQGAFTPANIRAIIGPLLGYADPTQLTLIEADRAALTAAHTYAYTGLGFGVAPSTTSPVKQVWVNDDCGVSDGGVQLLVNITCTNPEQLSFALTNPQYGTARFPLAGGLTVNFPAGALPAGAAVNVTYRISDQQIPDQLGNTSQGGSGFKNFIGALMTGNWLLQVTAGAASCTVNSWSLFVEGGGARDNSYGNSGLGMEMHEWTVKFEAGKSTSTPDFVGAGLALERISPADSDFDITRGTNDLCDDPLCVSPFISA